MKRSVYVIDLADDRDYHRLADEFGDAGSMCGWVGSPEFRREHFRRRYLLADIYNHRIYWGGNGAMCPLGEHADECVPIKSGIFQLSDFLQIYAAYSAAPPDGSAGEYIVRNDPKITDLLTADGFERFHIDPRMWQRRNDELIEINTFNKSIYDVCKEESETISAEEFLRLYTNELTECGDPGIEVYAKILAMTADSSDVIYVQTEQGAEVISCSNSICGTVKLKRGTYRIRENAFQGRKKITDIYIPDGTAIIEENAFEGCAGLHRITIPKSVLQIHRDAFKDVIPMHIYYGGCKRDLGALHHNPRPSDGNGDCNGIHKSVFSIMRHCIIFDCSFPENGEMLTPSAE